MNKHPYPHKKSAKLQKPMDIYLGHGTDIATGNDAVISLERLKGQLLQRLDALLSHLLNFSGENLLRWRGTVNAVGFDRNDNTTANLEEQVGVQADDTGLIRLRNIGEDNIDHRDQHSVAERVASVFNDWDDVCTVGGHVDQISARSVGELDSEDSSSGANDISNVRDGSSRCSTEVEDFGSRLDEDFIQTTEDTGCKLGAERVPHSVFSFRDCGCSVLALLARVLDADALLAVYRLSRRDVFGYQHILLSTCNEDSCMTMGFLDLLDWTVLGSIKIHTTMVFAPPLRVIELVSVLKEM
jgi:hypothetical protein